MNSAAREKSIRDFSELPDVQVFVFSKDAGNAGLNLTAASKLLVWEPAFNPTTDAAFLCGFWMFFSFFKHVSQLNHGFSLDPEGSGFKGWLFRVWSLKYVVANEQ